MNTTSAARCRRRPVDGHTHLDYGGHRAHPSMIHLACVDFRLTPEEAVGRRADLARAMADLWGEASPTTGTWLASSGEPTAWRGVSTKVNVK